MPLCSVKIRAWVAAGQVAELQRQVALGCQAGTAMLLDQLAAPLPEQAGAGLQSAAAAEGLPACALDPAQLGLVGGCPRADANMSGQGGQLAASEGRRAEPAEGAAARMPESSSAVLQVRACACHRTTELAAAQLCMLLDTALETWSLAFLLDVAAAVDFKGDPSI